MHMNHLQNVLNQFNINDHGLQQSDVERQDRMNWESAQRILFPKVSECLDKIQRGDNNLVQKNVHGTILYLKLCWRFVEIFYSHTATLLDRVHNASTGTNFMRIWRLWIYRKGEEEGHVSLKMNFLSRETFQDVSLACHYAVTLICASRDFAPDHRVHFERSGTDCCEDYFSANGSFV